ncbi:MAG: YciI family protein [Nocardioides sp.]|uniref:YciI family protein n=1 Tax=Nocardioides sp. TaxID=35761 RepID=UPI0039E508B8
MKFVVLIHSDPQPWGHPTFAFTEEGRARPQEERAAMVKEHDALLAELSASHELAGGRALSAPGDASVYRWGDGEPVVTQGPYAETTEHLAGFFLLDVTNRERAEEIARRFTSAGDTVELRAVDHTVSVGF